MVLLIIISSPAQKSRSHPHPDAATSSSVVEMCIRMQFPSEYGQGSEKGVRDPIFQCFVVYIKLMLEVPVVNNSETAFIILWSVRLVI